MNIYTDTDLVSEAEIAEFVANRKRIPDEIFYEVLKWLPVPTADFVLTRINNGTKEFLLGYRFEPSFQHKWFVPGGRLNWGELPVDACKRHLKRELSIENVAINFIGNLSVINPGHNERPTWNSIWNLYEVPVDMDTLITPNAENAKIEWFTSIDPSWVEPVRKALEMIGFK
ncbi:MAG: NUDIX hydrolase [Patescibacteria group bacterium]